MRSLLSFEQKSAHLREKNGAAQQPEFDGVAERHLTVREVSNVLRLSDDKVRRMFQDEAGVLVIGDQSTRYKRRYTTLRIPESVLRRVIRRVSNA